MQYEQITKIAKDWGAILCIGVWMYFTIQQLQTTVSKLDTTVDKLSSITKK
jgi:hypothetical protein